MARQSRLMRGDDVLSALINLGYHRPLAEKAVDAAIKTTSRRFRTDAQAGAAVNCAR
ncbi:MAG: RuvA C-terminal domain-containing protein [Vicinamibacterales bacterium]